MASGAKPTRKAGTRAPIPPHIPRQTTQHLPEPCGCGGKETVICEDVSEVLDYVPACFRVLRHVRPRIACRSCETIRQAPAIDLPLPKVMASSALRSEEHTSELQSTMRIWYAVFCLQKNNR